MRGWFGTGLNTYAVSLLLYPTSHPDSSVALHVPRGLSQPRPPDAFGR